MTIVGSLVTMFTADMTGLKEGIAQYGRELTEAEKKNKDFEKGLDALTTELTAVIAGFTLGAAVIAGFIKQATAYGDAMNDSSVATGLSVEQLQRWKAAGLEAGVSFEELTNTARMMVSRMGELSDGGSQISKDLAAIGVSAYDANGKLKSTDTLLWDIVNGLAAQPAGTERASKAIAILGRSWYNLTPMIDEAAKAQEAYNKANPISAEKIKQLDNYNDALAKAAASMERWGVVIGDKLTPLIPPFIGMIDGITAAVEEMSYRWDVAQYNVGLGYTLLTGQKEKYEAMVNMGYPKRQESKPGGAGAPISNTYMPDMKAQEDAAKAALEAVTDAMKEQTDALKDLNDEKQRLADLDKDYVREMSAVGWDVGRARDLTMRHSWATQDQQGKVGAASTAYSQASSAVDQAKLSIAGDLVLNINGMNKNTGQIINEGQDLAKQRIVAGVVS